MFRSFFTWIIVALTQTVCATQPILINDLNKIPEANATAAIEIQNSQLILKTIIDSQWIFSKFDNNFNQLPSPFSQVKFDSANFNKFYNLRSAYAFQTRDSSIITIDPSNPNASKTIVEKGTILATKGDSLVYSTNNDIFIYSPATQNSKFVTNIQNISELYIRDKLFIVKSCTENPLSCSIHLVNSNNQTSTLELSNRIIRPLNISDYKNGFVFLIDSSLFYYNESNQELKDLLPAGLFPIDYYVIPNSDSIAYISKKTSISGRTVSLYNGANHSEMMVIGNDEKIAFTSKGAFYTELEIYMMGGIGWHLNYFDFESQTTNYLISTSEEKLSYNLFKSFHDSLLLVNISTSNYGNELFRCNTTSCSIVKDVWPGKRSSLMHKNQQYAFNDSTLFVVMTSPLLGKRIYQYDFNKNKLQASNELNILTEHSNPKHFVLFKEHIYFIATQNSDSAENLYQITRDFNTIQQLTNFPVGYKVHALDTVNANLVLFGVDDPEKYMNDNNAYLKKIEVFSSIDNSAEMTKIFTNDIFVDTPAITLEKLYSKIQFNSPDNGIFQTDGKIIDTISLGSTSNKLSTHGTILHNGSKKIVWSYMDRVGRDSIFLTDTNKNSLQILGGELTTSSGNWITGNDSIIYAAMNIDFHTGVELYKISESGLQKVIDIKEGGESSTPREGVFMNENHFYFAANGTYGWAIYKTQGNFLSTKVHHRVSHTEENCSDVSKSIKMDSSNFVYFAKCNSEHYHLYRAHIDSTNAKIVSGFETASLNLLDIYTIENSLIWGNKTENTTQFWRFDLFADTVRKQNSVQITGKGLVLNDTLIVSGYNSQSGYEPHYWVLRESPVINTSNSSKEIKEDTPFTDTLQLKDYMTHRDSLKLKIEPDVKLTHLKDFEYEIAFDPKANICGEQSINITATNRFGLSTTKSIPLNIQCINDAPTVTLSPSLTLPEDSSQTYKFYLGLDDGDPEADQKITFSTPEWDAKNLGEAKITKSNDSLFLEFSPTEHWNGEKDLVLKWKDDGGTADGGVDTLKHSLKVTLKPVEDEPEFIASTDTSTMDALELNLNTLFADPDSINQDTLKFSAQITSGSAAKMHLKGDQLSITPLRGVKGQVVIQLSATDKAGNTATQDLKINVGTTGLESFAVGSANVHLLSQGLRIETVVDSKLEIFDLQGKPLYSEQFFGKGEQYRSFAEMNLQSSQGYLVRVSTQKSSENQIFSLTH